MKMKYTILVASMMTVLLSGCSKKTEAPASDMAATEVVAADAVVEAEAYGSEGNTENYQKK